MVPASGGEIARLPLYLKGNFDLYTGDIEGIHVIWARVLNASETTPDRLIKQGAQMKGLFHMPIIFVFEHLDAYQRKRFIELEMTGSLIRNVVPVAGQLFHPFLGKHADRWIIIQGFGNRGYRHIQFCSYILYGNAPFHCGWL